MGCARLEYFSPPCWNKLMCKISSCRDWSKWGEYHVAVSAVFSEGSWLVCTEWVHTMEMSHWETQGSSVRSDEKRALFRVKNNIDFLLPPLFSLSVLCPHPPPQLTQKENSWVNTFYANQILLMWSHLLIICITIGGSELVILIFSRN